MPLTSFHKLAEEADDLRYSCVTLLSMTVRCGSTLACQMIGRVPNVRNVLQLA